MSELSRIVKVNITRQATAVSQKGFGTALILGQETEKPVGMTERVRVYSTLDSLGGDFASTTQVYKAAQAYFGQSIKPEEVTVGFIEGTESVGDALTAIKDENSDWYAVGMIDTTPANQEALSDYIATDCRIAAIRTSDADSLTTSTANGIGGILFDKNADRTMVFYTSNSYDSVALTGDEYPEFAYLGRLLPELPGSVTWNFKQLSGITVDNLTDTGRGNLADKNINWYNRFGGVTIAEQGTMASGTFIDLIRGSDFIQARMEEAIFSRLVNTPKIPFTNAGVDLIVNDMSAVLQRAVEINGILRADPYPVISKPLIADVPFNDRALRCLPDLTFTGEFAGAIHKVCIRGTISV